MSESCPKCGTKLAFTGPPIHEGYCPNKGCTHEFDQMVENLKKFRDANKPMSEWRDISTAPKDGLIVLTCWGELSAMAGFDEKSTRWVVCIPPKTFADLYWQKMFNVEWSPEYWMPLPQPPEGNTP